LENDEAGANALRSNLAAINEVLAESDLPTYEALEELPGLVSRGQVTSYSYSLEMMR
jgi:hypothetical protein